MGGTIAVIPVASLDDIKPGDAIEVEPLPELPTIGTVTIEPSKGYEALFEYPSYKKILRDSLKNCVVKTGNGFTSPPPSCCSFFRDFFELTSYK